MAYSSADLPTSEFALDLERVLKRRAHYYRPRGNSAILGYLYSSVEEIPSAKSLLTSRTHVTTIGVIQARMGSSRLPGKVMLPLNCRHVLEHDVRRVAAANSIDEVVVATSNERQDDIIETCGKRCGVNVFRGSETDVLERTYTAARHQDTDNVVRVTSDCPLVSPETIDIIVDTLTDSSRDYVSNTIHRTFPTGLDVEAFTIDSFERVVSEAVEPRHREHVTPYYRENPKQFSIENVTVEQVFDEHFMYDRADLRLTLDEADDYELLRAVYENVPYNEILDVRKAIQFIDDEGLEDINLDVTQKSVHETSDYSG